MKGILLLLFLFLFVSCGETKRDRISWKLNGIQEIGGNRVTVLGDPVVLEGEGGEFVEFDGRDDGLLIDANPIDGMKEFAVAVDFIPYPGFPENREQRFLHIQDPENENRRILIELRLNDQGEWYGDWFIKSENESLTLIDSTMTHPVNEWATIQMSYRDGVMKGYVNGKEEVSGEIRYLPIGENARTSVGTRMDQRSWFRGGIREVRFSPEAGL